MKLTTNWQLTISACLVIGIFLLLSNQAWAENYECGADNAPWNSTGSALTTSSSGGHDELLATTPFACLKSASDSGYTKPLMTKANPKYKEGNPLRYSSGACGSTRYGCAWCPSGSDICARIADCEAVFGGEGYKCMKVDPFNRPQDNQIYECIPYHCPFGEYATGGKANHRF
ncbi:MAG: hypothetical protein UT42_C0014G0020 [Candidatus Falkowbacteria bacterium GW2011_GWA2_39_24]|uniref:Uncharacterized protein n=1 Tax=Candidatus Falkowbacteria bacterium GW2011_GWA2_39_24 TaxID=1618634 RepID=A0A0G0QX86_9BACT|nr:MAG: hypothetical protein UT42_C0014G0020 [Candidatus Falkowbacteria bacterium GW2011_GWA2_39_24]